MPKLINKVDSVNNPSAQKPILILEDLEIGYAGRPLLPPISLQICAGERWAVIGPNGSGKSTLLRTVLGLQPPLSGRIRVEESQRVSFVPQRVNTDTMFPMRVREFIADGLDRNWSFVNPWHRLKQSSEVRSVLRNAGLLEHQAKQLRDLSEGQKQRAMVARATISKPSLLVLDEPTSAMDIHSERRLFELLGSLCERVATSLLVVVHHLHATADLVTHFLLVDSDHQVVVAGSAEDVAQHGAFVRHFGAFTANPAQVAENVSQGGARGR